MLRVFPFLHITLVLQNTVVNPFTSAYNVLLFASYHKTVLSITLQHDLMERPAKGDSSRNHEYRNSWNSRKLRQ